MAKKKRVLICEDEPDLLSMLSSILAEAGFEIAVAHDGQEAIDHIKTFDPDLMLLDLLMPIINGFEVLKYRNSFPSYRKIPVIVLSNMDQTEDIEKAKKLGVADYLLKTDIHLDQLVDRINSLFKDNKRLNITKLKYY